MVNVTIDQLLDGSDIKDPTAIVAFNQGGTTYKGTQHSNSTKLYTINNQTHLESLFGTNLEIPDGVKISLEIRESFTLTKPIKIGLGTVLEIFGATPETTITYLGTSPLFQKTNSVNDIRALLVRGMFFTSDGTQPFCDLKGTSRLFLSSCSVTNFAGANIEFPFIKFDILAGVDWTQGWIIHNPSSLIIANSNLQQSITENVTFISIITNVVSVVSIYESFLSSLQTGDALFFFDSNSPAGTSYIVKTTPLTGGDFYQKSRYDVVISSVTALGGFAGFNTATNHNLKVGDRITHAGFFTVPEYNGVKIVISSSSPTQYTTSDNFIANDSGELLNTTLDILSVADNTSGKTRFTTISSHKLHVGKVVVIDGFLTQTTYNGTAIVTAVDTPETGTTFDADIPFVATDTGTVDANSQDQTFPQVKAANNTNQPSSMVQGEWLVDNTPNISVISSPSTPVPIEDLTPFVLDFLPNNVNELFSLNTSTGELEYTGLEPITIDARYTIAAIPATPGTQQLEFGLYRDGGSGYMFVPNTRKFMDTSMDTSVEFTGTFFNVNPGDKLRLYKISNTTTNNTLIRNNSKLILLGRL